MSRPLTVQDMPVGSRYNRLVTTSAPYIPEGRCNSYVDVRCDCGTENVVIAAHIRNGHTKSCGCHKSDITKAKNHTHGLSRHPLYTTWAGIVQRTTNPRNGEWPNYGERGITLWPDWRHNAGAFITWVESNLGSRPEGMTLDRIDNNRGYEPGNLRWATPAQQARNSRPRRSVA